MSENTFEFLLVILCLIVMAWVLDRWWVKELKRAAELERYGTELEAQQDDTELEAQQDEMQARVEAQAKLDQATGEAEDLAFSYTHQPREAAVLEAHRQRLAFSEKGARGSEYEKRRQEEDRAGWTAAQKSAYGVSEDD